MSNRRVENWIESYLDYTDNTEPHALFRRWVAISVIASVMQRKCRVDWGMETWYPNMYIVLVGPPAARKGTAMKPGKRLLQRLGIPLAADETSRQKLISAMKSSNVTETTEDGINMHCSLTILSTELTVFLGYESRELLSMLCKWYDCEDHFVYDTFSRGEEEIPNVWANLIGATTPGQLQASLPESAVGSGFTSRVIFVYQEDRGKMVVKPTLNERRTALEELLLQDLGDIGNISGRFRPTEEFEELYEIWYKDTEGRRIFSEPRLDYYVQRRPTHLFKLALIYSAARGNSKTLTRDDFAAAVWTLEETEKVMPSVFRGIGTNPLAPIQLRLMKLLAERGQLHMAEIASTFFNDVDNAQLAQIITTLEMMGYCSMDARTSIIKYTRKTP